MPQWVKIYEVQLNCDTGIWYISRNRYNLITKIRFNYILVIFRTLVIGVLFLKIKLCVTNKIENIKMVNHNKV